MAFSHRPTWHAARARGSTFDLRNYSTGGVGTRQIQELDLPSHMTLKFREVGQGTTSEIAQRDLIKELEDKEKRHYESTGKSYPKNYGRLKNEPAATTEGETPEGKDTKEEAEATSPKKEFDDSDDVISSSGEESSSDDNSDEDEQEEIMRELEKIKQEREEQRKKQEEEAIELEAKLLQQQQQKKRAELKFPASSGSKVKRRWDEDVVFR